MSIILLFTNTEGPIQSVFIFLRAFRMVRLLRFVNEYGGAATITALIYAAPQIRNVLILIGLITFIYAILGMNLFASVMYREYYNSQNNFRNIVDAILLLIRCLTGEDWHGIMHDLAEDDLYDGKT